MFQKKKVVIKKSGFNKVIAFLTTSDIFVWGTISVINTLIGLYLAVKFGKDTIEIIGLGTAIYFVARSLFQVPVGILTDRIRKDRDEIFLLSLGCVLMGLPFLLYPYIEIPIQYYLLQFVFGIGSSMNLNTWRKLFARNVDKGQEGFEYGLYESLMSLATALFSTIGGFVANINRTYFEYVIIAVGLMIIFGGICAAMIFAVKNRQSRTM